MPDERKLPDEVSYYAESPIFTSENIPKEFLTSHDMSNGSLVTVPNKLLDVHNLKAGTWGTLNVRAGNVDYFLAEHKEPQVKLGAGDKHVILPEEKHFIEVSQDAVFQIKFYKKAS